MSSKPASLGRNIINLFISQGASFIIPLLQFPYLTRVLGVEEFGLFVFSYSIIVFLMMLTNYGFELYIPSILAEKNTERITNKFFSETVIIRTFLFIIALFIITSIYLSTNYFNGRKNLLFAIILAVFFNSYNFLWLFQSKEAIYLYSRINVLSRLLGLAAVFIFVKKSTDLAILLNIVALTNACILITCYLIAKKLYDLRLIKTSMSNAWKLAKNSFEYFLSRIGVGLYAALGGAIIGTFSGSLSQVAYYGAAHQLYNAGLAVISAISTPLLPYMSRTKDFSALTKITIFSLGLTFLGASFGWLFGEHIIAWIYGADLINAKKALNVFMVTIILSVLGQHLGYPALLPLGKGRHANLSVMYAGLTQVILITLLVLLHGPITAVSVAIVYLICDFVMTAYRAGALWITVKRKTEDA